MTGLAYIDEAWLFTAADAAGFTLQPWQLDLANRAFGVAPSGPDTAHCSSLPPTPPTPQNHAQTGRILGDPDQRVHRCPGCGGWLYASRPCRTCQRLAGAL